MTVMPVVEVVDDASGELILGSIVPRRFTPPAVIGPPGPCGCGCALTEETSYGFKVVTFATERLQRPLWPWQRWFVIHAGELRPDGIPRFRRVILTVGRQSGKTEVVVALTLYWLIEEEQPSVLGTSTLTRYAKKPWRKSYDLARHRMPAAVGPERTAMRKTTGEEEWHTSTGATYTIAAANGEGGRSMTNNRVIADEFAKQHTYDAYGAAYYSMDALEDAQYFGLTTPDPAGQPYQDLRGAALKFIDTGEGDPTLGYFGWVSPDGAPIADLETLRWSNPTLNRPGGKSGERMLNEARAALLKPELLKTFKTEVACIEVDDDDRPINLPAWKACLDPGDLAGVRDRLGVVFDVAPSLQHCTLSAAAVLPDGRVRVEVVKAWAGRGCAGRAAREMPDLVARINPRVFAWLPGGPAAAAAAKIKDRSATGRRAEWPPPGVLVQEITAELVAVCMGFASLVDDGMVAQSDDPLLNDDVQAAEKLTRPSGTWVFSRKGQGDCDALYSAAGAAHVAQTLPAGMGTVRLIGPTDDD